MYHANVIRISLVPVRLRRVLVTKGAIRGVGGETPHMTGVGMLVGNFEFNS